MNTAPSLLRVVLLLLLRYGLRCVVCGVAWKGIMKLRRKIEDDYLGGSVRAINCPADVINQL